MTGICPQVYATDRDAGDNGKVQYSIVQDSSRGFFRIEPNTGWIKVASAMSGVSARPLYWVSTPYSIIPYKYIPILTNQGVHFV